MMETWVSKVPVVAAVVGAFIAVVQFLFTRWQEKKLAKLLKVFKTLDTDLSGAICYSELKAGLEKRGFHDDEIRTIFAVRDLNQ